MGRRIGILVLLAALCIPAVIIAQSGGDLKFTPAGMDPILFSHDHHTKVKGVKCMACHFNMFEKTGKGYQMKREKLTKKDFCEYCHNGMKGFDAQSTRNCTRCHVPKRGR